jgi:hypothetical protein
MRALAGIGGALLVALMLSEFFVTFLLPRRVRRDPRIARGLSRSLWRPWRAIARRLKPAAADTFLGFFGPLALIVPLFVWTLGLIIGFGLLEWAVAGGSRRRPASACSSSWIGYLPPIYSAFSRRETAVERLRREYEPNAQALAQFLALEVPAWR